MFGLEEVLNLLPLGLRRVHSSGVVGTHVQHDQTFVRHVFQVFQQSLEVEAVCLRVEVLEQRQVHVQFLHDLRVDGPRRVRDTDGYVFRKLLFGQF